MNFEEIQDKLIINKDGKVFLVYGMETVETKRFMSSKKQIIINCLDLELSISRNDFIGDSILVSSIDDIKTEWEVLPKEKIPEKIATIVSSFVILTNLLRSLKEELESCNSILQSFKSATERLDYLNLSSDILMIVSFKDLDGNDIEIKQEEILKISEVVLKIIQKNIDIDTEDVDQINILRNQIELGILESVSDLYSDAIIKINTDLIKRELLKAQGELDGEQFE